jgi:hypothetical protein
MLVSFLPALSLYVKIAASSANATCTGTTVAQVATTQSVMSRVASGYFRTMTSQLGGIQIHCVVQRTMGHHTIFNKDRAYTRMVCVLDTKARAQTFTCFGVKIFMQYSMQFRPMMFLCE